LVQAFGLPSVLDLPTVNAAMSTWSLKAETE
jgi:hypothetical protein